jgi:hypothetical protein
MKQQQNILARADNFVGKHSVAVILIMMAWVLGMFTGYLAIENGIQHGYWEKSGYYYIENNIEDNVYNFTSMNYSLPDYSKQAIMGATPMLNQSKIIIFECFNSSLNLNNNQISCIK